MKENGEKHTLNEIENAKYFNENLALNNIQASHLNQQNEASQNLETGDNDFTNNETKANEPDDFFCFDFEDLQNKIFLSVLQLKSKLQLSETLLNEIINEFSELFNYFYAQIFNNLKTVMTKTKNNECDIFQVLNKFVNKSKKFKEAFNFINSSYKQKKLIESNELYVKSKPVALGLRNETKITHNKRRVVFKRETFEYVSIVGTLTSLLKQSEICNEISQFKNDLSFEPSLYGHTEFWQKKNTLRLLLYYDEIEVRNPLGDVANIYKLGMFYFSILNLTRKHNSRLNNIWVVATSYASDLKKYGINRVLDRIMIDIKQLETTGIKVNNETYFASIAQVSGDNLGIHQMFGLKCCFSSTSICHLCNANTKLIQEKMS